MIRLAIDLLGADTPEEELCRGALSALSKNPDLFLYLCGSAQKVKQLVEAQPALAMRCEVVDCPVAVTNYDNPMDAYQQEDASIVKAMKLAKNGADGVITCGATGAVLVCSIMILGKLHGLRPILAVELRNACNQPLLLLDCGANIDSRPELYLSFAHLGDAYMKCIGYENPRIALLSNGAEDTKGCEAVKVANTLLRAYDGIRFVGNIEATHALTGETDVIVCDGFHGNILLKSIEGSAKSVLAELTQNMQQIPQATGILEKVRRKYDYNTQGGAMLLGVRSLVMKGHGSATGDAVENMIAREAILAQNRFLQKVEQTI